MFYYVPYVWLLHSLTDMTNMTGDVGFYDEDNYVYIVNRIKDIFKVDGCQVKYCNMETAVFSTILYSLIRHKNEYKKQNTE